MKPLLFILLVASAAAQAEIYKYQDENGEWTYSDRPAPQAKPLKLPPLSTYTPTVTPAKTRSGDDEKSTAAYKSMQFVSPKQDQTIRNNAGSVEVGLQLTPFLKSRSGHKIQYYLDGKSYKKPVLAAKLVLDNVERGTHVLGASVVDADGGKVFEATPVTFHMRRFSARDPNNLNNPNNPRSLRNPDNIANNPNNPYSAKNNPNAPGPINPNPGPKIPNPAR